MTSRRATPNNTNRKCLVRFKLSIQTPTRLGELTRWRYAYEVERFARSGAPILLPWSVQDLPRPIRGPGPVNFHWPLPCSSPGSG